MQRLRTRFPTRKHIVPSMLKILSFKELLDVRKDIPKEYMKGSMEYHQSIVNVSKYLVENHAGKIDARSVQKIKDEIRQSEASVKMIKDRMKLKERVLGCASQPPTKKDSATVILKTGGKAYRMPLRSSEICRAEVVLKCDFCIPSVKKTNYLHSFETELKKGMMSRHVLKDYAVALVLACSKVVGVKPDMLSSVIIEEHQQSIVATVSTSSGNKFKVLFMLVKDIFKMIAVVVTKTTNIEIIIKGE